ncbi:MAG: FAD-linked oxidase C-terminal domain-containing protein [Planctomycetaceae bacterium]
MDGRQQRIADDLAGSFDGELRFDRVARAMYATDASLYQIAPVGVAFPRHADDVVSLARYAEEANLPLVPRGAGTGLAGSALGGGLVVDFSRWMTAIEALTDETVRVQPGVVRDELNRALRPLGRYFPPDPSNTAVTTVGGMLGVDAAGSHAIRVGSTRDHVVNIEAVLVGGERCTLGDEPIPGSGAAWGASPQDSELKRNLISRLAHLLRENRDLIQARQPSLIRNCAGYYLRSVLTEARLNMPRLLVGSEGTLALFTAATLHTSPLPPHRGVGLLLFGRLESAINVVQALIGQQPSACDLLDRRLLSLGRESETRFEQIIPLSAEAGLIVEQTGYTESQVRQRLRMAFDAARQVDSTVRIAGEAYRQDDIDFLWSLPQRVVPNLTRLRGESRPQPFVEDIAVPPGMLRDVLRQAQQLLQKYKVTASLYAHAASGQIHLRPFLPIPTPAHGAEMESLARELYEIVLAAGGTISGEHGDGLPRTAFLQAQYGPLYKVFREIKRTFDPHNLLNPGKIVSDDPHLTVKNFRPLPAVTGMATADGRDDSSATMPADPFAGAEGAPSLVPLQLLWSADEVADESLRCNGCGICRTQSPDARMCPVFRVDTREEASPRAKANAMRTHLAGFLDAADFTSEEMKQLANLCFNCKQCQVECPSSVDVPHLMIEAKAQYTAANGLRRSDWILSRAHSFGELGCRLTPFSNWLLGSRAARWLLERLIGVAAERKLPRFARQTFLQACEPTLSRRNGSWSKETAVYFVDHFANYHDPQVGWSLVKLLEQLRVPVYVPPEQTTSALAMISAGDLDTARTLALENVRILGPLAREGHLILCTEPAAVIALRDEYPRLIDHPDVRAVADQVRDAGRFLQERLEAVPPAWQLEALPHRAAYHTPCHTRALYGTPPYLELLRLIPELQLEPLELGCSGMAGAFGLTSENLELSLAIGRPLMDRMAQPDLQIGITECSSCRMQMEQGTNTPTVHPLKLLALSAGLLPEVRLKLNPNHRRLLVT